jgi:hypothetical protein
MAKRETLEDVIRMATRVQTRMAKDGIRIGWTIQWEPQKSEKDCAGSQRKRTPNREAKP